MPPPISSAPPTFVPGLWGSLSKEERERIAEKVKAEAPEGTIDSAIDVARYVNRHADQFLPSIQASDLKPGAAKRVTAAVAKGMDLETAIRNEAAARFGKRFDNVEAAISHAVGTVRKSDPILAEQLASSQARLAAAKTPEEKVAALVEARRLMNAMPGHAKNVRVEIGALKDDEEAYAGQAQVGSMGSLFATAQAIDKAGNSDGRVDQTEVDAYFTALETKVGSAEELIAQREKVLKVAEQLTVENGAGTLAEKIDGVVRVGGGAEGADGKLIGNGDGLLTRTEVNAFIAEMKTRPQSQDNTFLIQQAEILRKRFIKP